MTTVRRFEDLLMFQKAREVYKALANCKDHGFRDQIQRASVSVLSNIAEGFESGTRTEFLHYLFIAKASAGEVRAQTYVGYDVGYLNIEKIKYLNGLAEECSKFIYSFIQKTKQGAEKRPSTQATGFENGESFAGNFAGIRLSYDERGTQDPGRGRTPKSGYFGVIFKYANI
jgi:four helix bundle protein